MAPRVSAVEISPWYIGTTTVSFVRDGLRPQIDAPLTCKNTTANPCNYASSEEHAHVRGTGTDSSSNDQYDTANLDRTFPPVSVGRPCADEAAYYGAGTVDAIESPNNIGRVCIAWFTLRC